MIGLAFDENFNNDVLRGLLRRNLRLNGVRIQDAGLRTLDDETVLEWAAQQGRVLITHDVSTMTTHAYARVAAGGRCRASLKFPAPRPSPSSSKTCGSSRNVPGPANGKDRCATCRCGEAGGSAGSRAGRRRSRGGRVSRFEFLGWGFIGGGAQCSVLRRFYLDP